MISSIDSNTALTHKAAGTVSAAGLLKGMVTINDNGSDNKSHGLRDPRIPFRNLHRPLGLRHRGDLEMVHRTLQENPALALPEMQMVPAKGR